MLCGRSLRLRHGWVGVVNRGQMDINKRMTMVEARSREQDFFRVSRVCLAYGCVCVGGL